MLFRSTWGPNKILEIADAITEKRDFSAKAALMNGGVNLALGGIGAGLAGLIAANALEASGRNVALIEALDMVVSVVESARRIADAVERLAESER